MTQHETEMPALKPGMYVDLNGQKLWLAGISRDGRLGAIEHQNNFGTVFMDQLKPWREKRTVTVPEFWTIHWSDGRLHSSWSATPQYCDNFIIIHHPARTIEVDA